MHNPRTRARSDFFMLPSDVQPQPPRQPSEAAYGCSGRTRQVGAILRCVLTSYATAARPHPLVRREPAPEPRLDTVAAAGRHKSYVPSPVAVPAVPGTVSRGHAERERPRLRAEDKRGPDAACAEVSRVARRHPDWILAVLRAFGFLPRDVRSCTSVHRTRTRYSFHIVLFVATAHGHGRGFTLQLYTYDLPRCLSARVMAIKTLLERVRAACLCAKYK